MLAGGWAESSRTVVEFCRRRLDPESEVHVGPYLEAISREPSDASLMYSLAVRCLQCGYLDLWRHCNAMALAMPHLTPQDLYFRGQAKIRMGDWSGWTDREARTFGPTEVHSFSAAVRQMRFTKAAWNGAEDLAEKTLLVFADGGHGDCIQVLRYVPALAQKARKVILAVHPRCVPFAQHNLGHVATVVMNVSFSFEFQRYVWMMSLPALFGGIPPFRSFSAPKPLARCNTVDGRLRIAICWAGNSNNPASRVDRYRSLVLSDLAPLFARDDVEWHSVQVGEWSSEAHAYPSIVEPAIPLQHFAQTANVVAGMDAVITIDTAVAHLAGSLGVPTFLILSTLADFRWETSDTTPWYPSMELLRQRVPGDWTDVTGLLMDRLTSRQLPRRAHR
jgi:hypothetical protein